MTTTSITASGPVTPSVTVATTTNTTGVLVAAVTAEDGTVLPERWHAYLTIEGLRTTDHRYYSPDAFIWRDLPLVLGWQPEGNDHYGTGAAGWIDTIERRDGGKIYAEGRFDLGSDTGKEAARQVAKQLVRWVSVIYEALESEFVEIGSPDMDDFFGEDVDWYENFTSARIAGADLVVCPAFPQAVIVPIDVTLPEVEPMGEAPQVVPGMIACAVPDAPPAAWFANPALPCLSPTTVTNQGRVLGHLAGWDTPHIGYPDYVYAPHSQHNYAYAMTGRVLTAEGTELPIGHLTLGTGHADGKAPHHAAAAHYDNTGTAVADVAFGEDEFGIWFSGALRPGVTDDQVRILRASGISGDWRPIGGNLELVAALCVNVPGFPIPQLSVVAAAMWAEKAPVLSGPRAAFADGHQLSLVGSGIVRRDPLGPMRAELTALQLEVAALNAVVRPLLPAALAALAQRVGA